MNNFRSQQQQQDGNFPPPHHFHPRQGFLPNQYNHNMCPPTRFNPQLGPPNPGYNNQNAGFDHQSARMCLPNPGFDQQSPRMCPPNPGYNNQNPRMRPSNIGFDHQNQQMCPPNAGCDNQNPRMCPPNSGSGNQNPQMCPPNYGFDNKNPRMCPPSTEFDNQNSQMCPPNPGFGNQNPQMGTPNPGFDNQNPRMCSPNTGFDPQNQQMCPPNPGFGNQNPRMGPPNAGFDHQSSQMYPSNPGFNNQRDQLGPPNPGFNPPPPRICPPEISRFNSRPPSHPQMEQRPPFVDVVTPNRFCPPHHASDVITPEKIVKEFLERKCKLEEGGKSVNGKEEKTKKGNVFLKIHEAQSILREAKSLVEKLKNSQQCDDENTNEMVNNDRLRLQHLTSLLEDEDIRQDVKKKVEQRKKRRERIKRRKKQNEQDRKVKMEKYQAEHQRIDEWQESEKRKLDEQRAEEKRREEIEESLTEIKKEKVKISKCMTFVNTLAKLRKARYKASLNEDKHVPEEATRCFEERTEKIGKMLAKHVQVCSLKEEQVTKLMKNKHEERAECLNAELKHKQLKWQQLRKRVLFGQDKDEVDVSDELWTVAQLHKQAETNIQTFLINRQHWDVHVSQQSGSTIPIDWIEPVAPSSDEWSKYLLPTHE